MDEHCTMNSEPFHQCCCNCKSRLTDYYHCSMDRNQPHLQEISKGGCVCAIVKGYICAAWPPEGIYYSNWPEHSTGCEMYDQKVSNLDFNLNSLKGEQ